MLELILPEMLPKSNYEPTSEPSETSLPDTNFRSTFETAFHEESNIKKDKFQALNEESEKVADLKGMIDNSQAKT